MQVSSDELPAFMAVLVAGKFKNDATDRAIAASPIVAAIATRAAAELIEYQISKYGISFELHALAWQDFRTHQEEWRFASRYATDQFSREWSSWSFDKQLNVIDNLISPFKLDDEGRAAFIEEFLSQ